MSNPLGLTPEHFAPLPQSSANEPLPWELFADKVNSFVVGVFKVISIPIKPFVILAAIPVQVILSAGVGVIRGLKSEAFWKTLGKCALFGATYFFRLLLSSVGVNLKGGASYEWRNEIEKGLWVSGVPLKSDVSDIQRELKSGEPPKQISKEAFLATLKATFPDEHNPTRKAIEEQIEGQEGHFTGVVIDVTEREELTPTLRGRIAETEDWKQAGILHINIPSEDMKALDVRKNVDLARFANACRQEGVGVLVHCAKGIGRSAGVAITMMAIKEEAQDSAIGDVESAPSRPVRVEKAIADFKKARAYGLNPLQELAVHESKVQALIDDLLDSDVKSTLLMAFKTDNFTLLADKAQQHLTLREAVNDYQAAFNEGKAFAEKKGTKELDKFTLARAEKAVEGHLEYVKSLIKKGLLDNDINKQKLLNLLDLNATELLSTPQEQQALSIPEDINLALNTYLEAYNHLTQLASTNKQKAYTLSLERLETSLEAKRLDLAVFPSYGQLNDATIQTIKKTINFLKLALQQKLFSNAAVFVFDLEKIQLGGSPIKTLVEGFTKSCLAAHPKVKKEFDRQARERASG